MLALFGVLTALPAFGGAWLQPSGSAQLISTLTYYTTQEYFTADGSVSRQPRFTKLEESVYAEYGWSDTLTAGGNIGLQYLQQERGSLGRETAAGMGNTELFLRFPLWKDDVSILSLQPMVYLPSPQGGAGIAPGSTHTDYELRLLFGHNFGEGFMDTQLGYRMRTGNAADEMRWDITAGVDISEDLMLLSQLFTVFSVRKDAGQGVNVANPQDYDLIKLQLSGVVKLDDTISVQAGVFKPVWGKNTGAGEGMMLSLWVKF